MLTSAPLRSAARTALTALPVAVVLAACATTPRAVAPRPLRFACPSVTPAAFAARTGALLREFGWTVRDADSTRGVVRGTRGPVFAGLGENLTVDGPYFLTTAHDGQEARVTVQVIETHQHRVIPVENLGDRSSYADARNFLPVVDGLRTACGAPVSGRIPPGARVPTLPPGGGGAGAR